MAQPALQPHLHAAELLLDVLTLGHTLQALCTLAGVRRVWQVQAPQALLLLTVAAGSTALLMSLLAAADLWDVRQLVRAYALAGGAAPQTLLAAYHDVRSPARMLLPRKLRSDNATALLSGATGSAEASTPDGDAVPQCTNLSGKKARGVFVEAGRPLWSLPDNTTASGAFAQTLV